MSLDINTKKGQQSLEDERVAALFLEQSLGISYIETPKDSPAKVDAILMHNNKMFGVAETKCRYNLTLDKFQKVFNNEWLVTKEKIDTGIRIAESLGVCFYGILYLVNDGKILVQRISQSTGDLAVSINNKITKTQKTINGGKIDRLNSYIDMSKAKIYTINSKT